MGDRSHQGTIAEGETAFLWQGRVKVGGEVGCSALNREGPFGEHRPVDALIESLHDRDGFVICRIDEDVPGVLECLAHAASTDDEDLRAVFDAFLHDRDNIHRGGHDH